MRGHFLPREQYAPECRKGLGQDVSRTDEIGIALVIAGDTAKHLSREVAPIVLTTTIQLFFYPLLLFFVYLIDGKRFFMIWKFHNFID